MHIDWQQSDWSYLLGVVHGDGHIAKRSVSVSVSYKDADYAAVLDEFWKRLGFSPKTYRARTALRIDVHNVELRNSLAQFKTQQRWSWPESLCWPSYLAGVIDTDGCVTLNKSIIIILKRSGNLGRLAREINKFGVREITARDTQSIFKGTPYLTESLNITGMDRIVSLCSHVRLLHPRKQQRLEVMLGKIAEIQSRVPLWKEVGLWIQQEGPKTWLEIAEKFHLKKPQVDSVLGNLKLGAFVEAIPPPDALYRFRVSGL